MEMSVRRSQVGRRAIVDAVQFMPTTLAEMDRQEVMQPRQLACRYLVRTLSRIQRLR